MICGKKNLIVVAHPDDEVLGCGGVLSLYADNKDVDFKILFIGEGTSCRYSISELGAIEVKKEIERRNGFAKNALGQFNIDKLEFLNLPCGRLDQIPLIDIGKEIERVIKEYRPCIIFTHSEVDLNSDHQIVFKAVMQATRPGALNLVKRIYSFEVLSTSEWRFTAAFMPNVFVGLSESNIQKKINSLGEYETEIKEFPFPRSERGIRVMASYRGMQSAQEYAEAYKLIREII